MRMARSGIETNSCDLSEFGPIYCQNRCAFGPLLSSFGRRYGLSTFRIQGLIRPTVAKTRGRDVRRSGARSGVGHMHGIRSGSNNTSSADAALLPPGPDSAPASPDRGQCRGLQQRG